MKQSGSACEVSVVLPVFNERKNLAPLLAEIEQALSGTPHEIVAVDDASRDGSLDELLRLHSRFPNLRTGSLAPHCGQSGALMAGIDLARGRYVVTMDADGQNDPAEVPRMLETVRSGSCDAAVGYRIHRADTRWKRFQSIMANAIRNRLTGDVVRDTGCSLRVVERSAYAHIPRFDGMHRFIPTLLRWGGATVVEMEVSHRPRRHGRTNYGMWNRAVRAFRDAVGVRWLGRRRLVLGLTERVTDVPASRHRFAPARASAGPGMKDA